MPALLYRWLTAGCWVYLSLLFGWLGLYTLTGDRIPYVALLSDLAVYFFVPLPAVMLVAPFLKRREIWAGGLGALAIFIILWGEMFAPPISPTTPGAASLRVMTFNVLGRHDRVQPILDVIRDADPDIVFLQEVNPRLAAALEENLLIVYPYQVLAPREGVTGMGVISRYPLRPTGTRLPLDWVGDPQLLWLTWNQLEISLVNFHLFPSGLGSPEGIAYVYRAREEQARILSGYASMAAGTGPVILAGDANVTDLSDAYQILTVDMHDAWREAGEGLGHTFPGSDIPGSSRPTVAGVPVPRWLARIDYLLYSSHWKSTAAYLGLVDNVSDHRAVVAELTLVGNRDRPSQVK